MARKPKVVVTDDQIRELIKTKPMMSNRAIAIELGMSVSGPTNTRINRFRATINGEAPIGPTLNFSDIRENDRLTRAGKRLVVVTTDPSYIRVRRMDGSTDSISRKDFSEHAAEYTRVPVGDPQGGPVTTYHIPPGTEIVGGGPEPNQLPLGSGGHGHKPGMTINQDFEEAIQEEEVDYIDPDWGVVEKTAGRDYLDRINDLLDIMAPECRKNPLMVVDVKAIAMAMLERGFDEEVRGEA